MSSRKTDRIERAALLRGLAGLPWIAVGLVSSVFLIAMIVGGIRGALGF